jgi:hypothetical protein
MKFNCDYRITCLSTSCCDLETFKKEIYITNLVILIIILVVLGIASVDIFKNSDFTYTYTDNSGNNKNDKLKTNADSKKYNFNKSQYNADKTSSYNIAKLIINLFVKGLIIYLIISKLIEVKIINTYSQLFSDKDFSFISDSDSVAYSIFKLAIELLLILYSFSIIQFGGHVLEYHRKYIAVVLIYLLLAMNYFMIYSNRYLITYDTYMITSYVCTAIVLLVIILAIYANTVFFLKLSKYILNLDRQDGIAETNLHKRIIENYSAKLSEDNKELYKETTRFLDMHKLNEIVQKIRVNRKLIVDIGLVFLYTLALVLFVFNTYMCIRNFNIAYIGYVRWF